MIRIEYWAGLFDGEGYVGLGVYGGKKFFLKAQVSNTYRDIIESLYASWGGSISQSDRGQKRHLLFQWAIHGTDALRFLESIEPHSVIKRDQIRLAIAYMAERPESPGRRGYTQDWRDRQLWYCDEFKRLKRSELVTLDV